MTRSIILSVVLCFLQLFAGCQENLPYPAVDVQRKMLENAPFVQPVRLLDSSQIVKDIQFLASEKCAGRKPGTVGHELAMQYILMQMRNIGLDSFNQSLIQTFAPRSTRTASEGKNIIGWLKGKQQPEKFLVISAHYDHVGTNLSGEIYYGADDNASGVSGMLALARYFKKHPQSYSIIFAAFDMEESGLQGAMKYVEAQETNGSLEKIKLNLNLDMIARSDSNELFVCGLRYFPQYKNIVEQVRTKTNTKLLMGHDYGGMREDWTRLSDQYAFYKKNIPFLYISVEDHADYHQLTDTVDRINLSRFIDNCNTILMIAKAIEL